MPHTIRLREPWQSCWTDPSRSAILYQRSFNGLTGLVPHQSVCLVIRTLTACELQLTVNGQPCELMDCEDQSFKAAINLILLPHNRIELVVSHYCVNPNRSHDSAPVQSASETDSISPRESSLRDEPKRVCPQIGDDVIASVAIEIGD